SMLRIYSSIDNIEKDFRGQRVNSTDEYGNYFPDKTELKYRYPWISQSYPGSSVGLMWDKLFQMNDAKSKAQSNSNTQNKKRFDYYDPFEYVKSIYETAETAKTYWYSLLGIKPPVDYAKETQNLFSDRKSASTDERKARAKMVA